MHVAFRVDASPEIGAGHLMRCLTLANALREQGVQSSFYCASLPQSLDQLLAQHVHHVVRLDRLLGSVTPANAGDSHEREQADAAVFLKAASGAFYDWIVVDHYQLAATWEQAVRACARHVMVIDDLANRHHACELLLDQTYGRRPEEYRAWAPDGAQILAGSHYALLRSQFAQARQSALARRVANDYAVETILIMMGGMDNENVTQNVLDAIERGVTEHHCKVLVIMGAGAPWISAVRARLGDAKFASELIVGADNVAALMAQADLAIGAAGTSSWERCCLGLPTLSIVIADNQKTVAARLEEAGATVVARSTQASEVGEKFAALIDNRELRIGLGRQCAEVTDGMGAQRVAATMVALCAAQGSVQ